jgi:hypothetical protein
MDDPVEYALVLKAITECPHNCIRWKPGTRRGPGLYERVISDPDLLGLHPAAIKKLFIAHVRSAGSLNQGIATDEEYKDDFPRFYWTVVPHEDIPRGIYVKCVLWDDDEEMPQILLVSVHQASFKVS